VGKILFWAIVIIGGLLAARILARYSERNRLADEQEPRQVKRSQSDDKNPESMVRCTHCGIHLPRSEAVLSQGRIWCSQEHAKLGERQ